MSFGLVIREEYDHLSIRVSGSCTLRNCQKLTTAIRDECEQRGYGRALCDMTKVSEDLTIRDWLSLGDRAAKLWQRRYKVAIVRSGETFDKFFDANNQAGFADVRMFVDIESALQWLKGLPPQPHFD